MANIIKPDGTRVTIHNNVAYFTGHVSKVPYPTLREQTKAVLARYDELFQNFNMKKENIIYYNGYFRDISQIKEFQEEFDAWRGEIDIAGVTVQAPCITPTKLVELAFIVAVD